MPSQRRHIVIVPERKTSKGTTVPSFLIDDKYGWVAKRWKWTLKDKKSRYLTASMNKSTPTVLHRFLWQLEYRSLPEWPLRIDHINGNPLDNRIENLRVATPGLNSRNQSRNPKNKKSGLPMGVCVSKVGNKDRHYQAQTRINGRLKSLGRYATPNEAHRAYAAAKERLLEEEHNRISTRNKPCP